MGDDKQFGKQAEYSDLNSLKLDIGDTLQLQDVSTVKQYYYVKLIGYLNKRSVMVSHPMQDNKLLFVKEGQGFVVRGFSGTKTYEFNANVLGVCLTPFPYLHLSFPEQIKTFNMRSSLRIKVKLVCSVEIQGETSSALKIPATVEDMSPSGARIRSNKELCKVGESVIVSFRLPIDGEDQVFLVAAIIRNVQSETSSDKGEEFAVNHGVEFTQTEGWVSMALQNFIYKTMAEN